MALSDLHWRYVGNVNFVSGIANSHDAVYSLGIATTYADGSPRTPGTNSAWTWQRQQITGVTVAVYGVPPINALSMSYIVAGDTTTTAYPFVSPDTTGIANCVVYGMNRASGAFSSWVNAQPFTSGFSGYWKGTRIFSIIAYDNVAMWESEEGCVLIYSINASGNVSHIAFGALFDPLSTSALDAETDGRRYYMSGSGSANVMSGAMWGIWAGAASDQGFLEHMPTANNGHCGTFSPGATTLVTVFHIAAYAPGNNMTTVSGNIVRIPFVQCTSAVQFLGQSRQMYVIKDAVCKQAWLDGATTVGYIVGPGIVGQADACLLLY